MSRRLRILVVDGQPVETASLCRGLLVAGHDAAIASESECRCGCDLIVADVETAYDVARLDSVRNLAPAAPVLVTTGMMRAVDLATVHDLHGAVLTKPFSPDDLDAAVRAACGIPPEKKPR